MSDAVTYETNGYVAIITMNKPDRMNRLDEEIVDALHHSWKRLMATDGGRGRRRSLDSRITKGKCHSKQKTVSSFKPCFKQSNSQQATGNRQMANIMMSKSSSAQRKSEGACSL